MMSQKERLDDHLSFVSMKSWLAVEGTVMSHQDLSSVSSLMFLSKVFSLKAKTISVS